MKTAPLYSLVLCFILGWWLVAFQISSPAPTHVNPPSYELKTDDLLSYLSPIQRESLKMALAGNTRLMIEMIRQWDKDAEILSARGIKTIQRLPTEDLLKAILIGQLLHASSPSDIQSINHVLSSKQIIDDCNLVIDLPRKPTRILPQTDMSASFLLALCDPKDIIALPIGVSKSLLYDAEKIKQIPVSASSLRSEHLHLLKPEIALLAHYSQPSVKELFNKLSIPFYTTKNLDTVKDIQTTLLKVGHLCKRPLEATLLSIFMDSAFLAIDNRIAALSLTSSLHKVLYLYHHHHFMVPTTKCLSGQLMTRATLNYPGMTCSVPFHETHWRIPFEQEKILQSQPDCILMASAHLPINDALQNLPAAKSNKIFFLDEYVQESPNQYIVLAYYDIFQALAAAHTL